MDCMSIVILPTKPVDLLLGSIVENENNNWSHSKESWVLLWQGVSWFVSSLPIGAHVIGSRNQSNLAQLALMCVMWPISAAYGGRLSLYSFNFFGFKLGIVQECLHQLGLSA
ncbi:hypothetical protein F4808DRAFT_282985 [Astrocystis sublimbata]|nr:hypothetical protein F4808DRAFT_282985 [Astrocystis sublimbata]